MNEIETNRELYCFIADVVKRHSDAGLTLEAYLSNLRRLARRHQHAATLGPSELARMIEAAFDGSGASDASDGSDVSGAAGREPAEGYAAWEARLDEQLRDLREMAADGTLASEHRHFGLDAPSGARWYNFDPCTFLECAAAGTFGGWQEGDDTGRALVPGPVTVLDASGEFTTMDPRELAEPVAELQGFAWPELVALLDAGQMYE